MAQYQVQGIRRRLPATDNASRVEVLVPGGWMRWAMLSKNLQAYVLKMAAVRPFLKTDVDGSPSFIGETFSERWGEEEDLNEMPERKAGEDRLDPEEGTIKALTQLLSQDGDPGEKSDEKPTFQMPDDGDGDGTGTGGGGDDGYMVSKLGDPETGPLGGTTEGAPELVPFDEAYGPRAAALGQAVMDQTLGVTYKLVGDAMVAIIDETGRALQDTEARLLEATQRTMADMLSSFTPETKGRSEASQIIVKMEIQQPNRPIRLLEGLQHNMMPRLVRMVASGQHTYLPGPPGSSKSHSAKAAADGLDWRFGSISLGPTTPESRLWGGMDAKGDFHQTAMTDGLIYAEETPESGFLYCMDEMDNGHPGILATVNSLMANGWVTLPNGRTVTVGSNFVVVACANTFGTGPTAEFAGRNRLDAATLDRFAYLPWDTDKALEASLVKAHLAEKESVANVWLEAWEASRQNVETHGLKVFVTMRGAINGAKMLAMGDSITDTWNAVLGDKLPMDQRKKVNPL